MSSSNDSLGKVSVSFISVTAQQWVFFSGWFSEMLLTFVFGSFTAMCLVCGFLYLAWNFLQFSHLCVYTYHSLNKIPGCHFRHCFCFVFPLRLFPTWVPITYYKLLESFLHLVVFQSLHCECIETQSTSECWFYILRIYCIH